MATTHQFGALYNSLTAGSKIIGTVVADSDFRIDGVIEGDIQCKGKIVIGEKGAVQGDVTCQNADILGCVEGKMKIENTLSLRATGSIKGDVQTKILIVEPKAQFNGSCSMKQEEVPASTPKSATPKEEPQKPAPKTVAEKKKEEAKAEVPASTPDKPAEPKKSLFSFGQKKDEAPKAEPKKEAPKPAAVKAEEPVLAVNESSIGNGQEENIITFIDDEPEIVAVEA